MADRKIADAAPVFAALGDKTRLRIVSRLCQSGSLSIVRLTEDTNISRQAVSKHLRELEEVGLLGRDRTGRERVWKLQTQPVTVRSQLSLKRSWVLATTGIAAEVEMNNNARTHR
jgi:DNA-binding transcriptional ArsR family regulator